MNFLDRMKRKQAAKNGHGNVPILNQPTEPVPILTLFEVPGGVQIAMAEGVSWTQAAARLREAYDHVQRGLIASEVAGRLAKIAAAEKPGESAPAPAAPSGSA